MTAHTLLIAYLLIIALAAATRAHAATPTGAQIYTQIVSTWRCQDNLGHPRTKTSAAPLPKPAAYRAWVLNLWKTRYVTCRTRLNEIKRQWAWQSWLPDKWRRIGVCETQLNWQHYNSSYEGAFGFARQSWDSFKPSGYPDHASQATPWQQYQVALNIYRRYGLSGWGCRNA